MMRTVILSALLALSVLAGVSPANEADPQRGPYGQFSTGQGQ